MEANRNIVFVPGGYEEATLTSTKKYRIYLRKGFIKLALEHGYTVYPIFVFGENKAYKTFDCMIKILICRFS